MKTSEPPLVLLADDDPDDVYFMQRAFKHSALSNRLFVVANGLEALAYLQGSAPYPDRQSYPLSFSSSSSSSPGSPSRNLNLPAPIFLPQSAFN